VKGTGLSFCAFFSPPGAGVQPMAFSSAPPFSHHRCQPKGLFLLSRARLVVSLSFERASVSARGKPPLSRLLRFFLGSLFFLLFVSG